jgi:preprotein translocase subunit SecA
MDGLRDGIGMRAYGQRDPKLEYQREGFGLFEEMNARIDAQALELVFKFALPAPPDRAPAAPGQGAAAAPPRAPAPPRSAFVRPPGPGPLARPQAAPARPAQPGSPAAGSAAAKAAAAAAKVGRNDPCPCGSGKKHKKCCGAG